MHRLVRGAQIGTLALLLVIGAGNVGCKKGSSGTSTHVFDASGGDGNSTDGIGGSGGVLNFWIYYGGAGSIEVSSSGSVDASFTPTSSLTPELGANPLVVTSDLSIPVVTAAPALDTPYLLEDDSNLYVSDGDMDLGDETPVTGLQVQAGVIVTLGLNTGGGGSRGPDTSGLAFSDDLINHGTITVVDFDTEWRGNIELFAGGHYIGSGRIETFGTIPGQNGGRIEVGALGNGYNSGDWASYGADRADGRGGNGGTIYFYTGMFDYASEDPADGEPGGLIENTGHMTSNGGAASGTLDLGGAAGEIAILPYLSLWNSGDLDAIGGDSLGEGGRGGIIQIAAYNRGDLRNTGDLTSDGGDFSNDSSGGFAGEGGEIFLAAYGGELRSSGVMLARGGDSLSESDAGGQGGYIGFYTLSSNDDYEESELDVPAGDIWVSGAAIATGGDALGSDGSGGNGGLIDLSIVNDISEGTQAIHVLGIEGLHARGGHGGLEGGDAEIVSFDLAYGDGTATGAVNVEPPMNSSGGNADPGVVGSVGGDAGDIAINAGTISYGSATADGGTGQTPGADGMITPETMAP